MILLIIPIRRIDILLFKILNSLDDIIPANMESSASVMSPFRKCFLPLISIWVYIGIFLFDMDGA